MPFKIVRGDAKAAEKRLDAEIRDRSRSMNTMPIDEIIQRVTDICKKNHVRHLSLFGSFATGTALPASDIDFVVYGCKDMDQLEDEVAAIETLRKIDLFDYDHILNKYLLEDIDTYGKKIY